MHGYGWFGNGFCDVIFGRGYFGIGQLLILIGIVAMIMAVVLYSRSKSPKGTDALETLKTLYVSGKISEEEYLKRKSVLERK